MKKLLLFCLLLATPVLGRDRFLLLPLDNRPCNVLFVRQLAGIARAEVVSPPDHWLGSWLNPGQCERFAPWLKEQARPGDRVLVSSDMLCYGGLVASRNAGTPEELALSRLSVLAELHERGYHLEVLSTVPRLYLRTSEGQAPFETALATWAAKADRSSAPPEAVPPRWVEEYLGVRRRNLRVLLKLVELAEQGVIDRLVVGQDDSSSQGLHFAEQQEVRALVQAAGVESKVWLGSGADELTMDMVAGQLADLHDCHPAIELEYSEAGSERKIPPLESHPLQSMVEDHLALCGARPVTEGGEVRLLIQVPSATPFALPGPDQQPKAYEFAERIRESVVRGRRTAVADLALINRMDPYLAEAVLDRVPLTELEGFAAWNTPANALGTVVAQVVVRRLADREARRWPIARVKESARLHLAFLLARLVDDYGYQTMVRGEYYPKARGLSPNPEPLTSPYLTLGRQVRVELIEWAQRLYRNRFADRLIQLPGKRGPARLGPMDLQVVLPWPRLFEVEVRLDVQLKNVT
ncbi:hypothetical protein ABS71_10940 [bacterium SCN 62-11]|nr:DUF4127 family protein [Candidatus Eremiobacteraeota bacterium]ODT67384.1 MAG: hypothetical protein ABS71_10940 [bacterium SCN 62-11]